MKINQSQVEISAHHQHQHMVAEKTSIEIESRDSFRPNFTPSGTPDEDLSNLSRAGRLRQLSSSRPQGKDLCEVVKDLDESELMITGDREMDAQILALAIMVARLTGRPVYVGTLAHDVHKAHEKRTDLSEKFEELQTPEPTPIIRYETERVEAEVEELSATARGQVTTSDGREISFELSLDMERFAISHERLSIMTGELKDPLILDLGPLAARFTEDTIKFDIDADGELDDMPLLDRNGGFLVIDHNQNGVIDDGSEVVGALSGDGFADLKSLDQDGNRASESAGTPSTAPPAI